MKFIDLEKQQTQVHPSGGILKDKILSNIKEVMTHGKYILGPEVSTLEETLKKHIGTDHCIATGSGTDALLVSLMALKIKKGDEVITTPFSFIATAETIALLGAIPVYVDIDPKTFNIDPEKIEEFISTKTKAIIAVSLYGQPADFEKINKIAKKHSLPVIEDAAQSFGALSHNKKSCSLSTIGVTSFFPSKPLGCYGDGGACFTDDDDLAEDIRRISRHGQKKRYFHTDLGINGRLDTIQAAVLLAKWPVFLKEVELRNKIANLYTEKLNSNGIHSTPLIEKHNKSVFAQYTIRVKERAKVISSLKESGIPTSVHYPIPLFQQPALKEINNKSALKECLYKNSLKASQEVLSLPMHPYITEETIEKVTKSLKEATT
tara:strand:+ start:676 stop:1806 length:1131 start_codon:yes stop_codon:yes gene_type:complete